MKIRTQHVSNSSTSSYLIVGFQKDDLEYDETFLANLAEAKDEDEPDYACLCAKRDDLEEYQELDYDFGAGIVQVNCCLADKIGDRTLVITELSKRGVVVKADAHLRVYACSRYS